MIFLHSARMLSSVMLKLNGVRVRNDRLLFSAIAV